MAKRVRPLVLAAALAVGLGVAVLPGMVVAQAAEPVATEPDRDTDWGWIGLLGLAGLAGLARRSHAEHPMARPNPVTR